MIAIDHGFFGRDTEDVLSMLSARCRDILCEFALDCIHCEFGVHEDPGEVRQRTVTVELD